MVMPKSHYYRVKSGNSIRQLENNANSNKTFSSIKSNLVVDVEPIRNIFSNQIANSRHGVDEEMMIMNEVLGMIQDITASSNILNSDINVNMTDNSTNSLKTILDKVLSFAIRQNNSQASHRNRYTNDYSYNYYAADSIPVAAEYCY